MLLLSPDAFIHDLSFNYRRLGVMGSDELNSGGQSIWDVMLLLLVILLLAVFVAVIYRNRVKIVDVYHNIAVFILSFIIAGADDKKADSILKDGLAIAVSSLAIFLLAWIPQLSHHIFYDGYPDYFLIGLLGLLFIPNNKAGRTVLLFFVPYSIYFLRVTRTDHMLLPLYPFMVIGLSFMLEWSVKQLRSSLRFRHLAGFASVALALPVILTLCMSAYLFVFGQDFSREDVSAYQEVASYINANVGPSDIVVADPHTARFINAKSQSH